MRIQREQSEALSRIVTFRVSSSAYVWLDGVAQRRRLQAGRDFAIADAVREALEVYRIVLGDLVRYDPIGFVTRMIQSENAASHRDSA